MTRWPPLAAQGPPRPPARPRRSVLKRRVTAPLALFIILVIVFGRVYLMGTAIVVGRSMVPTLQDGDRLLMVIWGARTAVPQRLEIVSCEDPTDPRSAVIKQVIGLPGEIIAVRGTAVIVNDRVLDEPYAHGVIPTFIPPVRLGPDQILVLGDNRDLSEDSRDWGPISINGVIGRCRMVYFPLSRATVLR